MLNSFLFTYFNLPVMGRIFPMILEGFVLTVELAVAIVLSGILAAFCWRCCGLSGYGS